MNSKTKVISSKAQTQHVFLYLFAIIIIGALVLIGYKSISKITSAGCDAGKETFKSQLLSMLEQYDSRGSLHTEKLSVPCSFTKLCFLDSDTILGSEGVSPSAPKIIQDTQSSRSHTNIWINKGTAWEAAGWSEKVEIRSDDHFVCIQARGGTFPLQFNGTGRKTSIGIPS